MEVVRIDQDNRERINDFIRTRWFSTDMVVRGRVVDMTQLEGFVAFQGDHMIGLVTYEILGDGCEIMSLDSLLEGRGIGTHLLNLVVDTAKEKGCRKIKLITTNDNLNAIGFYQRKGFDLMRIYHNALEAARKLKPSIPLVGEFNIPLKHELEFEMNLE